MKNKFEIGDLVTSTLLYGLGVVVEKSDRSLNHDKSFWAYRVYYHNGKSGWQPENQYNLIAKANK